MKLCAKGCFEIKNIKNSRSIACFEIKNIKISRTTACFEIKNNKIARATLTFYVKEARLHAQRPFYLIITFFVFPDFIRTMFTPFCGSSRRLPLRS